MRAAPPLKRLSAGHEARVGAHGHAAHDATRTKDLLICAAVDVLGQKHMQRLRDITDVSREHKPGYHTQR